MIRTAANDPFSTPLASYDLRFLKYQSMTMMDRKTRPTTIAAVWFMARL
jgi:hypothetical protein